MTMTMTIFYLTIDIQIEIIMYNSLENQIINLSGDYYSDKLICRYHNSQGMTYVIFSDSLVPVMVILLFQK